MSEKEYDVTIAIRGMGGCLWWALLGAGAPFVLLFLVVVILRIFNGGDWS